MITVIIPGNNMVSVDGQSQTVDCSHLPSFIHAIQWDGSQGWIEFNPDDRGVKAGNLHFDRFDQFQYLVDRWRVQVARAERAAVKHNLNYANTKIAGHEGHEKLRKEHAERMEKTRRQHEEKLATDAAEREEAKKTVSDLIATTQGLRSRLDAAVAKMKEAGIE